MHTEPFTILHERVSRAYLDACELDMLALKPGNVGVHSPGHRMSVEDFRRSALASVAALTAPGASVGQRIENAIIATRDAVGTNTNLGIVLLCAPLVHAVLNVGDSESPKPLRDRITTVLEHLTDDDAARAFAAIRLANPAGLGTSEHHDVNAPVTGTLLTAMRVAAPRDSIARQYAQSYSDVWEHGLGVLNRALHAKWSLSWAGSAVFLAFLARYPDSHVERKLGAPEAQALQAQAVRFLGPQGWRDDLPAARATLVAWDGELKARRVNPGTSADLMVATLFLGLLR